MAQASAVKQTIRRYRNAKISEYCFRRVVDCFAKNMAVSQAAAVTKLFRQSVDDGRMLNRPIVSLVVASAMSGNEHFMPFTGHTVHIRC